MNIDFTVTALMFPAIPLIMAVYSNRFHTLSALVRKLHDEQVFQKQIPPEWNKQLENLNGRITLLKYTLALGGFGFLFNMLTVFALYFDNTLFCETDIWNMLLEYDFFNHIIHKRNFSFNLCFKITLVRYEFQKITICYVFYRLKFLL